MSGHFWVRCGNCGELFATDGLPDLTFAYAAHMRAHHEGANWHTPTGGWVEADNPATVKRIIEAFFACGTDTDQMEYVEERHVDEVMRYLATGLKPWEDRLEVTAHVQGEVTE